jgi:hypothetical protein
MGIVEDGGMGKATERSEKMRRVLEDYRASGLSRQEFCQQRSIALTTFDYWRRQHAEKRQKKQARGPGLMKVEVAANQMAGQFTLSLANGRRIESSWGFVEAELTRLIRIAENA